MLLPNLPLGFAISTDAKHNFHLRSYSKGHILPSPSFTHFHRKMMFQDVYQWYSAQLIPWYDISFRCGFIFVAFQQHTCGSKFRGCPFSARPSETLQVPIVQGWLDLWTKFGVKLMRSNYDIFTLQGTNISPKNGILKVIFLFLRWDMLISRRVLILVVNPPKMGGWFKHSDWNWCIIDEIHSHSM